MQAGEMTSGGYDPSNHPQAGQPYGQPRQYGAPGPYAPPPGPAGQQPPPPQPYGQQPPPPPPNERPLYQQTVHPQPQYGGHRYGQFDPAFGVPSKVWPRFTARLIDNLIVGLPLAILLNFVIMPNMSGLSGMSVSYAIVFAAILLYFVLMESRTGATLGKRIIGLKVVAPNGAPTVPPLASLKRNVYLAVSIIPCLGWVAGLALMIYMAATMDKDPNKQGWHDKLAGGTQVLEA
ncbi:RDD family protein [Nocardia sp. NPDC058499]|uniref:RDD family protein n=1 Tax=Nocardia sp. NPDC058499 TaxID=3346530 RepID=UPI003662FE54